MAQRGDQERTEAPTQRRREEARKRGQVAKSREVSSAAVLLAASGFLVLAGGGLSGFAMNTLGVLIAKSGELQVTAQETRHMLMELLARTGLIAGPILGLLVIVVIASHVAQFGFLNATEALAPNWSRINPVEGFKRMFSLQAVAELLKGLLKMGIVAWVIWRTVMSEWETLASMGSVSPWAMGSEMARGILNIGLRAGMVLAGLALLDFIYQKWEHERSLRMTKDEVKEEYRQREGDPKVRARIRQRQREMARRRMVAAVPKADVVITNPEHLAVAIRYEKENMSAPTVVAKGAGYLAAKIKEVAKKHGVEIVENKPLAHALYKMVEVGSQIPVELYRAVAEILAHVYSKRNPRTQALGSP